MVPVSTRELNQPDTISSQGFQSEMAAVRPREHRPLSCPLPDLEGHLKGHLGLMSPCLKGHETSKYPVYLSWCTLKVVQVICMGSGRLGFCDLPNCLWNRNPEAHGVWKIREPMWLLLAPWKALARIRYFCFQAFSSLPWYTLKAIAKTSACGVMGTFFRCIN